MDNGYSDAIALGRIDRRRAVGDVRQVIREAITMGRLHRADENWHSRLAVNRRDAQALVASLRRHILRAKEAMLRSMDES